jgi:hypothetical protein
MSQPHPPVCDQLHADLLSPVAARVLNADRAIVRTWSCQQARGAASPPGRSPRNPDV